MPISLLESRDQRACDQPSVNSPHNNPSLSSVLMLPKPTSPSTTPSTESSTEISTVSRTGSRTSNPEALGWGVSSLVFGPGGLQQALLSVCDV